MNALDIRAVMIIPAAGMSLRHPPNKLLLPVDGKITVVERTVETFIDLVEEIIVVTGFQGDSVRRLLAGRSGDRIRFAHNPDFATGLASSIRAGLNAVDNVCDYFGFCPGDKPFIQRETVIRLLDILKQENPAVLIPKFTGTNGHPVFFHRDLRDELLAVSGDSGGRTVLREHSDRSLMVPVEDNGTILDMDIFLENRGKK